jgi:hypothetical protein
MACKGKTQTLISSEIKSYQRRFLFDWNSYLHKIRRARQGAGAGFLIETAFAFQTKISLINSPAPNTIRVNRCVNNCYPSQDSTRFEI